MHALSLCVLALSTFVPVAPGDTPSKKELRAASRELAEMYREDQADQERWEELGDTEFGKRQKVRRDRALELVSKGLLDAPVDYYHAGFLFQHGEGTDDFLLAHVLGTVSALDGDSGGKFLCAAALDRYIQQLGRPQRFGTQFQDEAGEDMGDTSALVSEAIVEVFRGGKAYARSGLNGRPLEASAASKKELKKAKKDLKALAKSKDPDVGRALEIVNLGQLETADDFYYAAKALRKGESPDELLLAHICVTAASILEHGEARKLYGDTLDAYLVAMDRAPIFEPVEGKTVPDVLVLHASIRAHFNGKKR